MSLTATLSFHGAARGVTGSCYHLQVGDEAVVIDCGTFQGDRDDEARNRAPFGFAPEGVAALILTHGHLDHVGRSPLLVKRGFAGQILGHAATLEIASIILDDSAKIANHADDEPLYDADDVEATKALMRPIRAYRAATVVGRFTIELFDAGHILGSSSVRVSWRDGSTSRAVLFSGDLGVAGAPILRDPFTAWDPVADAVDVVVTESTYGDRTHPARAEVRTNLRRIVERAIADGGKVLIPAFSIGRTQEVLYELNTMIEAGELPGIPVVVDGPLGLSATRIYSRHRELYDTEAMARLERGDHPLEFDGLVNARDPQASRRAVDLDGPAIIIAGSGMCQGGRIRTTCSATCPTRAPTCCWSATRPSAPSAAPCRTARDTIYLRGQEIPVRARITTISGLSAHADRDGLTAWFAAIPRRPDARVFVTHGEEDQARAYASRLHDKFAVRTDVPAFEQAITL
jgi:metallo-beta-lactamase family protein